MPILRWSPYLLCLQAVMNLSTGQIWVLRQERILHGLVEVEVIDQDVTVTVVMQLDDTGIAEALTPEITIFPNPVRSTLHVESNIKISQIQLLDILGQRVITQTVGDIHHELSVSNLKDGLYFIQMFTDRGVKTLRVQIIR